MEYNIETIGDLRKMLSTFADDQRIRAFDILLDLELKELHLTEDGITVSLRSRDLPDISDIGDK